MPDPLFTQAELEAYPPSVTVETATADLVLSLVTAEIRSAVGAARYDVLTDVSGLKGVALALGRRMIDHPGGRRSTSRQIDDYTETDTFASESLVPAELTDGEVDRILRALGLETAGAFTIRPYGKPCSPVSYPARRYC